MTIDRSNFIENHNTHFSTFLGLSVHTFIRFVRKNKVIFAYTCMIKRFRHSFNSSKQNVLQFVRLATKLDFFSHKLKLEDFRRRNSGDSVTSLENQKPFFTCSNDTFFL